MFGCKDYPCRRFDSEREGYDSFVTYKKVFSNLDSIKCSGIEYFVDQQTIRMNILKDFLARYDDGRSKSFLCISCTLLPLDKLQEVHRETRAWDTQDVNLLISVFHPDMVWPWPRTRQSHDPMDWEMVLGKFDKERWCKGWQDLFDNSRLAANGR